MLNIMYFILFLLISFGILALVHKGIRAITYPLGCRYLHCRDIAAVFAVGLLLNNYYTLYLPEYAIWQVVGMDSLEMVWGTIMPQRFYELSFLVVTVMLLNLLVLLEILIVSILIRIIFGRSRDFRNYRNERGLGKILHLPWLLAMPFFEEQDDESVQINGVGFTCGKWAGGMKNGFLILGILEMLAAAICIVFTPKSIAPTVLKVFVSLYMLPAFGFELASQIELMLYAENKPSVGSFSTDDIDIILAGSSEDLLKGYILQFQTGSALLHMGRCGEEGSEKGGLRSNDLENQQLEDCSAPEILSMMMTQMRDRGIRMEGSYQNALISLLNGKCVSIRDTMIGEYLPYLAAYLNYQLSRNNTSLLLTGTDEEAERLAELLEKELHALNEIHTVWTVRTPRTLDRGEGISILVCSWDTFLERHIIDVRAAFTDRLFFVGFMDGMSIFSRDPVRVAGLFSDLERTGRKLQYLMVAETDSESLRAACSYYINESLYPYKADRILPDTFVMIWKQESGLRMQKQLGIGNDTSEYLGTALPLALAGAHFDMGKVYIMRGEEAGIRTFMAAGTREYSDVRRYVAKPGINLASVIRLEEEELGRAEEVTDIIVFDTGRNLMQTFWQWSKYGGSRGTLLHIVSPAGMMRDFFAANFEKYRNNSGQFDALIPHRQVHKNGQMAVMLMELCDRGVTEEYLMSKNEEFHWGYANVFELLQDCLAVAIRREEVHNIMDSIQFKGGDAYLSGDRGFVQDTQISLTDRNVRRRLMDTVSYAVLVRMGEQESELPILKGNIYNTYLRDQVISYGGELLYVSAIENGRVIAEPRLIQDLPDYYTISTLSLDMGTKTDECSDSREFDWNLFSGRASRRIYGYWESNCATDFPGRGNGHLVTVCGSDGSALETVFEDTPILQIRVREDVLGKRPDDAVRLLVFMLNELFRTLFPDTWQNILAVAANGPEPSFYEDIAGLVNPEEIILTMIPSVCGSEEEEGYKVIYVVEISCLEYGLVKSVYEERKRILSILRDYLDWYLEEEPSDTDAVATPVVRQDHRAIRSFLRFGMEEVPFILDPAGLKTALDTQIHDVEEKKEPVVEGISVAGYRCSFCGALTMMPYKMKAGDGRIMCRDCREHRVDQEEEVDTLYSDTLRFLEDSYKIRLRRDIKVRFKSAAAIRKVTSSGREPAGRVLGFYVPELRELWIESRGPRIAVQDTIIHEITHSWQYDNLNMDLLRKKLGPLKFLILVEGHAAYMEVRTMQLMNHLDFAERIEAEFMERSDEYGEGYRQLKEIIAEKEAEGSHNSPYSAMVDICEGILKGTISF